MVFKCFREFNLKLKPSKCNLFQLEIIYLAHHISKEGVHPSKDNMCMIEEFPMPETFTQVRAFCRLTGHYRWFIKGFTNIVHLLYDVLGKETKMGPLQLSPEVHEVVRMLKEKILTSPLLAFLDFAKPFLLEMDASKEGLGAVLSQKQDDGRFHPVTFSSHSLMPAERNYHSSKLEFLALKWGIMEHFRKYLAYAPFMVKTDNNPLTYILTTLNLDAMGHCWVGALASFEFELEYQKGSENGVANALSCIPIRHDHRTMKSLMKGAVMDASSRCKAQASDALRKDHEWLGEEVRLQAAKLAPMHMVDWVESQDSDSLLAACKKWLRMWREVLSPKKDTLLCELLGRHMEGEGCILFRVQNSLILDKDLLYLNMTPKGEAESVAAFVVSTDQRRVALNGVHRDAGHQGQARTLALTHERFWWLTLVEDCKAMIRGCQHCHAFEGAIPKAPLCPIRVYAPLELMHMDFTSIEMDMELNKPPGVKNVLIITDLSCNMPWHL